MAKKKKILLPSLIVTQSNKLVEARYNLPLGEQRLILTMIARIQPDDEDFKEYRINVREFADFLGIDKNSAYREFDKITTAILTRILIFDEDDGPLKVGWVSSAKYLKKEGSVLLCFDPKLKPYLLQLKGNFTSCRLEMLLSFKSQYTMRLYSLVKQYEKLKTRTLEVDELREMLGIKKDQYVLYSNFKKDVIESVRRELKLKADVYFEFEEIKYSRKVGAIRFNIFSQSISEAAKSEKLNTSIDNGNRQEISNISLPSVSTQEITNSSFTTANKQDISNSLSVLNLMELIPMPHRNKRTVISAISSFEAKHGFEYVRRNINYTNEKAGRSYVGFLASSLEKDWGHDWEIDVVHAKNNKPTSIWIKQGFKNQADYDEYMFNKQMERYRK